MKLKKSRELVREHSMFSLALEEEGLVDGGSLASRLGKVGRRSRLYIYFFENRFETSVERRFFLLVVVEEHVNVSMEWAKARDSLTK